MCVYSGAARAAGRPGGTRRRELHPNRHTHAHLSLSIYIYVYIYIYIYMYIYACLCVCMGVYVWVCAPHVSYNDVPARRRAPGGTRAYIKNLLNSTVAATCRSAPLRRVSQRRRPRNRATPRYTVMDRTPRTQSQRGRAPRHHGRTRKAASQGRRRRL